MPVLDALETSGLDHNTLVICTTDHGVAFPHMKCTLMDHGLGVMAILRGPGGFIGGRVVDAMITHLDIVPTLCELTDLEPPANARGRSLLPLTSGGDEHLHEAVYAEVNYHVEHQPQRSVRTKRYKYIRSFRHLQSRIPEHTDDSPSKRFLEGQDWAGQPQYDEELYDLVFDPHESHNIAEYDDHIDVLTAMRTRLRRWQEETADPLCDDA